MSENITEKLKELTKDVLNEESLKEITTAFETAVDAKASLQVESALVQQDTDHAEKVQNLLEAIDADHTQKLEKLVEAIDGNHVDKLKNVISRYESVVSEEAGKFKGEMVNNVSKYLDLYLENLVPANSIKKAAHNKRADQLLEQLRSHLGIDLALAQDSIKTAIVDGKRQITEATDHADGLNSQNVKLRKELNRIKANLILEQRTTGMAEAKRKYLFKVLGDKTSKFITENFEYTLQLFDKNEDAAVEIIREEATKAARPVDTPVDVEEEIIEESAPSDNPDDWQDAPWRTTYMDELKKF
jgi:uncharacterized protein YigA (DUF484 family)